MKTSSHLLISIVLVGLITIFMGSCDFNLNGSDNGGDVAISDPALRSALEEALNITSGTPITEEDMLDLTEIDMSNENISDLTGIEAAKNLKELYITDCPIIDIGPISGLIDLEKLDITDCPIIDIGPISGLEKLKGLGMGRTGTSDISRLAGLVNLEWLDASGNGISDIGALAGLKKLTRLILSDNLISDIGALAGLENLEWLDLIGNTIIDISPLGKYRKLARLFLGDNSIENIDAIFEFESLEWLDLSGNHIETFLPFISEAVDYTHAVLRVIESAERIKSIYSRFKKLTRLNLSNNPIKDIFGLEWLENLEWLGIDRSLFTDLNVRPTISTLVDQGVEIVTDVVAGVGKGIARGVGALKGVFGAIPNSSLKFHSVSV